MRYLNGAVNIKRRPIEGRRKRSRKLWLAVILSVTSILLATAIMGCAGTSGEGFALVQFQDESLGVQFKHPSDWTQGGGRTFDEQSTSFIEGDERDIEAAIVVLKATATTNEALSQVIQEKKSSLIEDGAEEMQQREVSLGGELAYELSYYEHTFQNISTIQIRNGYVYELLCYVRFYSYDNYEPMFREVIESFSYLEPATNDNRGS